MKVKYLKLFKKHPPHTYTTPQKRSERDIFFIFQWGYIPTFVDASGVEYRIWTHLGKVKMYRCSILDPKGAWITSKATQVIKSQPPLPSVIGLRAE